jgi:hypothetical protein
MIFLKIIHTRDYPSTFISLFFDGVLFREEGEQRRRKIIEGDPRQGIHRSIMAGEESGNCFWAAKIQRDVFLLLRYEATNSKIKYGNE